MKAKIIFRWYDLWIGLFIDRKKNTIYIFPIPTLGVKIELFKNWFGIERNPILRWLITRVIPLVWDGRGRIKRGDRVTYNWMARVHMPVLYSINEKYGPRKVILLTSDLRKASVETDEGHVSMVDVFWLKKYTPCQEERNDSQ